VGTPGRKGPGRNWSGKPDPKPRLQGGGVGAMFGIVGASAMGLALWMAGLGA